MLLVHVIFFAQMMRDKIFFAASSRDLGFDSNGGVRTKKNME